jgi:integrase/recombinase XerD
MKKRKARSSGLGLLVLKGLKHARSRDRSRAGTRNTAKKFTQARLRLEFTAPVIVPKAQLSNDLVPFSTPTPEGLSRRAFQRKPLSDEVLSRLRLEAVQVTGPASVAQPTAAPEAFAETASAAPAPAASPETTVVLLPEPTQHSSFSHSITTRDIIRPEGRLRESIEGFLLDQRSEHTRRAYGKDLRRFVGFLLMRHSQRGIEGVDRSVLIAYKDQLLAEGLEHTTIDRHLATLRSFFRWLMDDGWIEKNPAEGVRFLNPRKLSTTVGFSDEEVRRILKLPDLHTRVGSQHYAILMILFYCGLRRSELCALRTSSLTTERGHQTLRLRGKGNSERLIVLVPAAWSALKHYFLITGRDPRPQASGDQPLFSPIRNNRTGDLDKPLDPSMIFYIVRRYAKLAGIQSRVSPHSCRATAISNARDHNVPDRAIQEFAGWASPDMITRYDKRRSAIEQSAAHSIAYGGESEPRPMPAWVSAYER